MQLALILALLFASSIAHADPDLVVTGEESKMPALDLPADMFGGEVAEEESVAAPAAAPEKKKRERLFDQSKPLELVMTAPFKRMQKENPGYITNEHKKPYSGKLTEGDVQLDVTYLPRGQYRRQLCSSLPPIKIELTKGKRGGSFSGIDRDLKFVTHCKNGDAKEQGFVVAEYVTYKILAAAGLPALGVRLANVSYRDEDGKEFAAGTGFFIENVKDYARRHQLGPDSQPELSKEDRRMRLTLGQYMIRNTDFYVDYNKGNNNPARSHNLTLVLNKNKEVLAEIPYDFDLTSLVGKEDRGGVNGDDAAYNRNKVQELLRTYPKTIKAEFQKLAARKDAVLKAIDEAPLSDAEKKRIGNAIGGFIDEGTKQK